MSGQEGDGCQHVCGRYAARGGWQKSWRYSVAGIAIKNASGDLNHLEIGVGIRLTLESVDITTGNLIEVDTT